MIEEAVVANAWCSLNDVDGAAFSRHLKELAESGRAARSINKRRTAVRGFTRWLHKQGRMKTDPLLGIPVRREQTDRRVVRRALSDEELARLFRAVEADCRGSGNTEASRPRGAMNGVDRAMLYRLAVGTGLRLGEIASLTPQSFDLEADAPFVTIEAGYSKRRTRDEQPIRSDLADLLRGYLRGHPRTQQIWRLPRGMAKVLRDDLAKARRGWIDESVTPGEREDREESDFLAGHDSAGRVVDFHALRHTFITRLARANVSPKVAQTLARHSTITLTMGTYAHIGIADQRAALDSLPNVGAPRDESTSATLAATGTDDMPYGEPEASESRSDDSEDPRTPLRFAGSEKAPRTSSELAGAQRYAQRTVRPASHSSASGCTTEGIDEQDGASRNPGTGTPLRADVHDGAMGPVGFEPTLPEKGKRILSPPRLPVPPRARGLYRRLEAARRQPMLRTRWGSVRSPFDADSAASWSVGRVIWVCARRAAREPYSVGMAAEATCVVLLSGGLDSATALAVARERGYRCRCLSFEYGQRHRFELEAAGRVASSLGAASHEVIRLDAAAFVGSSLTGGPEVPKGRSGDDIASGIPETYVPARNLVFLSYGVAYAEVVGASGLFIGVNAVDYSGYPDCRPAFIEAFARAAALATKTGVEGSPLRIETPLIDLMKAEIIRLGMRLGVGYALTHSCYDPDAQGRACGRCDSCTLRRRGFEEAGVPDPTRYAPGSAGDAP
jgi:7-cyano-7-deazaguanine synthase